MSSAHTPGPWTVLQVGTARYEVLAADESLIAEIGSAEDADLIAAAPELLERAKVLLDRLSHRDSRGLQAAIGALKGAVRCAEGREA